MKVLFIEWSSIGNIDILEAFSELGHKVIRFKFDGNGELERDEVIERNICSICKLHAIQMIFSFNYFPVIAYGAKETGVPYCSWTYDNPYVLLYSYTIVFPTNYVFLFDQSQYLEFKSKGIDTVYYLPLATNVDRLTRTIEDKTRIKKYEKSKWCNKGVVSFVGSLYNKKSQFYDRLKSVSDYSRGYLEAIISAQKKVYGSNFIQEVLTEEIMDDMSVDLPLKPSTSSVATREYMFAEYVINRKITADERKESICKLATYLKKNNYGGVDLYTDDESFTYENLTNHGRVDYYDYAPLVFNNSKININISLRSIHTGVPLRVFDILGSGGFLITNYQADMADCYEEGIDYVTYTDEDDLLFKIAYYLEHDEERKKIAEHGFRTTKTYHNYRNRIQFIIECLHYN